MQILKKEAKRITVLTANGTELVCKPVRTLPIQDLMFKIGLPSTVTDSPDAKKIAEAIKQGSSMQQMKTIKASMALFNKFNITCRIWSAITETAGKSAEYFVVRRNFFLRKSLL